MAALLKIGMIGTGRIARRFVPEARCVEGLEIAVVCNPHAESAKQFAEESEIPCWTDKISELADRAEAVYIATPHETHYEYAKEMLSRGLHVLCEKPMVFSRQQAEELFALAKEKHCVLMEGIKTAYCPGFQGLLQVAASGKIGKIRDVEACFSRLTPSNVREMTDAQYGGSFLELGTYSMLPTMKLLGTEEKNVDFWSSYTINGTDGYTKAFLTYENAMGTAKTGLAAKSEGELVIAGTKGYIVVRAPWWLTKHFEVRYEDPDKKEIYEFPYEGQGLRYEIQAFAEKIKICGMEEGTYRQIGISPKESIWLADKMERFLEKRMKRAKLLEKTCKEPSVHIWAHRGCSLLYPENTLEAFKAAAELPHITGIELDVQMTRDKELVVIHDEKVDRTTNGSGRVCDYSLEELKKLEIAGKDGMITRIPTLKEVFDALSEVCHEERKDRGLKEKFLINIELKNSIIRYEGMEERVLALVFEYGLIDNIVFSSFLPESMGLIKEFYPDAKTGILGTSLEKCFEDAVAMKADAVHPWVGGLDVTEADLEKYKNMPVRAWNGEEPFFGQDRVLREKHLEKYAVFGVTDVFTNVPELYLK